MAKGNKLFHSPSKSDTETSTQSHDDDFLLANVAHVLEGDGSLENNDTPVHNTLLLASIIGKGGGGKSTSAIHIGGTFASLGLKTLLVDCDTQCDLSQFLAPGDGDWVLDSMERYNTLAEYHTMKASDDYPDEPPVDHDSVRSDLSTAVTHMETFVASLAGRKDFVSLCEMFFDRDCGRSHFEDTLLDVNSGYVVKQNEDSLGDKLWLLAGNPQLAPKLDRIIGDIVNKTSLVNHNDVQDLGIFRKILTTLAAAHKFDVIIVDLNPHPGVFNQLMVSSVDYVLPPIVASQFSVSSAHTLITRTLPNWNLWRADMASKQRRAFLLLDPSRQTDTLKSYFLPTSAAKIFPFLINNYFQKLNEAACLGDEGYHANTFAQCLMYFLNECMARYRNLLPHDRTSLYIQRVLNIPGINFVLDNLVACHGNYGILLIPNRFISFSVCESLGITMPELSWELYEKEYNVIISGRRKKEGTNPRLTAARSDKKRKREDDECNNLCTPLIVAPSKKTSFITEIAFLKKRYREFALWMLWFHKKRLEE